MFQVSKYAQSKLSGRVESKNAEICQQLKTWQDVAKFSESNTSAVIELAIEANQYSNARKWAEHYYSGQEREEFLKLIDQAELSYLLRRDEDKVSTDAYQVSLHSFPFSAI